MKDYYLNKIVMSLKIGKYGCKALCPKIDDPKICCFVCPETKTDCGGCASIINKHITIDNVELCEFLVWRSI